MNGMNAFANGDNEEWHREQRAIMSPDEIRIDDLEKQLKTTNNLSPELMQCLKEAEATAMRFTIEARIPECGYFGEIAQNLSYVLQEIGETK